MVNCPTIYFSIPTCKLIVIFTQTKSLKNENSDLVFLIITLWPENQMGSANFILPTFSVDMTNVLKSSTQTFQLSKSKTQFFMFVWKNRTFGQLSKKWDNAWSFTLKREFMRCLRFRNFGKISELLEKLVTANFD